VLHQFQLRATPEILIVSNIHGERQADRSRRRRAFLAFRSVVQGKPSLGSLLHAQELPAEGGDTLFANMHLAWDTLPQALRDAVKGRSAEHTYLAKYEELQKRSPWRPNLSAGTDRAGEAGRASDRAHASGNRPQGAVRQRAFHDARDRLAGRRKPRAAARALRAQRAPEHLYRHVWREHDLVFWDNRSLMHLAAGTPDHLRARCIARRSKAIRRSDFSALLRIHVPKTSSPADAAFFLSAGLQGRPRSLTRRCLAALHRGSLAATAPARAEGSIRIAEQFGVVYLLLNVARDQKLIEQEGKKAGVDIKVDWMKLSGGSAVNDALLSGQHRHRGRRRGPAADDLGPHARQAEREGRGVAGQLPYYLVSNNPNVKTIADFTEKDRIALPAVGCRCSRACCSSPRPSAGATRSSIGSTS
jgi:taurine dioxygenase